MSSDEEKQLEDNFNRDREDEVKPHPNAIDIPKEKYTNLSPVVNFKFMSTVLKKQATPKANKVLSLEIEVNVPNYDDEGNVIHDESSLDSDEEDEAFEGRFNAHLLEDEVLDQDSYKGSMTDDESNKSASNIEETVPPPKQMDAEEIKADIQKHLNLDFGDGEEERRRGMGLGSIDEFRGNGLGGELEQYLDNDNFVEGNENSGYYEEDQEDHHSD